jgi:hypothetical protein
MRISARMKKKEEKFDRINRMDRIGIQENSGF